MKKVQNIKVADSIILIENPNSGKLFNIEAFFNLNRELGGGDKDLNGLYSFFDDLIYYINLHTDIESMVGIEDFQRITLKQLYKARATIQMMQEI
jgi:hypothetical protein